MIDPQVLWLGMGIALFILGIVCLVSGLRLIFAREYRDGMRELVAQSTKINRRSITEHSIAPVIDATSRLIDSVATLVRTAFGMGAFLCLLGLALTLVAIWTISSAT